jgi:glycosyltransferase involved in cell wall biosynthesis
LKVTVIIPFHRNLHHLGESVTAARRSMPGAELLIAADGAVDDCRALAAAAGAQVVVVPGPSGPAVARNRAAALASGDVLAFVDADVVVAPDALPGMCRLLEVETGLDGVFGAYDLFPPERNFMSQYKNLSHAYVHEVGNTRASTFWAGLGPSARTPSDRLAASTSASGVRRLKMSSWDTGWLPPAIRCVWTSDFEVGTSSAGRSRAVS